MAFSDTLPVELLLDILDLVVQDSPEDIFWISHINKQIYQVTTSTPRFWTTISISTSKGSAQLANLRLARSGNSALSVALCLHGRIDGDAKVGISSFLRRCGNRIKNFTMEEPTDHQMFPLSISAALLHIDTSQLESLNLTGEDSFLYEDDRYRPSRVALPSLPQLKRLTVSNVILTNVMTPEFPFAITSLALDYCHVAWREEDVVNLFNKVAPTLEDLRISHFLLATRLQTPLTFPKVKRLVVEAETFVRGFVRDLELPQLEALEIVGLFGLIEDRTRQSIRQIGTIQTLKIHSTSSLKPTLILLNDMLPNVQKIDIPAFGVEFLYQSSDGTIPWPKLSHLVVSQNVDVRSRRGYNMIGKGLRVLVESRRGNDVAPLLVSSDHETTPPMPAEDVIKSWELSEFDRAVDARCSAGMECRSAVEEQGIVQSAVRWMSKIVRPLQGL